MSDGDSTLNGPLDPLPGPDGRDGGAKVTTDPVRRGGTHAPSWRRRAKSVTLREDDADSPDSLMDPATQSLSDALRITYRFVQLAVLVLVAMYLLSGFRSVSEGERGIRLLFGNVEADDIGPGFRFSWPEPFGELIKVQTGLVDVSIDDDFFPELTTEEKKMVQDKTAASLADGGRDKLNPELDGSNIMGDGYIAHTRWAIRYRRERPRDTVQNIDPGSEKSIVLGAVKSAIVKVMAAATIDDLLKSPRDGIALEKKVHQTAQGTLADLHSGIQLEVVSLTAKIAPRRAMKAFNEEVTARATANTQRNLAGSDANRILTGTAGEAAPELLRQIEEYEKQIELDQKDQAAATLANIDKLLLGEPVSINGENHQYRVFGEVASIMNQAVQEKTALLNRLQGEVASFSAKRKTMALNPELFAVSEWADAYGRFMSNQSVQPLYLPRLGPGGRIVMQLNRDPEINNRIVREDSRRKAEESQQKRSKQLEADRYNKKYEVIPKGKD